MFIRNGINSNLRERGRTALFSLLIFFLTVTMILSLSVLLFCSAVMKACDETYRSIALIEYMGSEFPNEDEPDAAARAAAEELTDESVLGVPGVKAWTRGNTGFASVDGYRRRLGNTPYGSKAVILVSRVSDPVYMKSVFYDENGIPDFLEGSFFYYTATLNTALYSQSWREGIFIDLLTGSSGFTPEPGKSYVLNGYFVDVTGNSRMYGDYPMNGLSIFCIESFADSDDLPYAEYTEGEEIPEVFINAAEQYRLKNNYVRVVPCRDVNDVYVFQQNQLQLADGTMPDPEVPGSCVISADLAEGLGLKPGDTFSIDELKGTSEDRYDLSAAGKSQNLTVSGITGESFDYCGYVWAIAEDADTPLFGYLLGTASLDNETAEEAVEALQAIVPEQVRVTLFDQGYGTVVQPFRDVRKTAVNVLLICSAGVAAVLLLFAFLFVGRQSDTVKIMVSLGTPGRKIALWFLSGALLICGAAAILGAVLGTLLRPVVFNMIAKTAAAAQSGESALRYSETSIGIIKQTAFNPQVPVWPGVLAALGIVVLALVFCILFLRLAKKGETRKRGRIRVHVPHGVTYVFGRGGLRFALLSIRRGGLRSLVVPLVSLVLTLTVLFLGGMYQRWQNELDHALDNSCIDGMVVSLDGRYYSNLSTPINSVRELLSVEGLEDISVSYSFHYWFPEEMPVFGKGEHGQEHRQAWIDNQPELVTLNSLAAAKEFYYSDPSVTWMAGWDENMLAETELKSLLLLDEWSYENQVIPAVFSADFLKTHGKSLGDTVTCMIQMDNYGYPIEFYIHIQVVGSYVQSEGKAHIYAPLSCYIPVSLLTGTGDTDEEMFGHMTTSLAFRTCRFNLSSARDLNEVRTLLKNKGFSAVGHISGIRTTLLLRDAAFLKLTESMERNIAMGRVMSMVISLLVILLGFIISWLMTFSRRREFALMRGFGAKKRRVFASFFLEQAILSIAGCIVGCIALSVLYAGGILQPLAVAAYIICYLLGTAISIMLIGKTDLMELLTVRE